MGGISNTPHLDTDVTLSADSDIRIPSQKAVKSYVDSMVAGAPDDDTGLVLKSTTINGHSLITNVSLTTADIPDSTNLRYVTDAELTIIGNTSGVNTGDQTNITGNAGTATKLQTARNINGVSFDGTADITIGITVPVTKTLYVNGNRTDTYVADGLEETPFKTIQAAVNQIITNGDNSPSVPYMLYIAAAATYAETVDFGNSAIVNISFWSFGYDGIGGASVTGLKSTTNNTNQATVLITGMAVGTLDLECTTNNGNFGSNQILINGCQISGVVTLKNIQNIFFQNSQRLSTTNVENVNFGGDIFGYGAGTGSALNLVTNNSDPIPSGFGGTFWICESSEENGNISIDAGSELTAYKGAEIGTSSATTVTVNGLYRSLNALTRSNITVNSGGEYSSRGGAGYLGTLTVNPGGTHSITGTHEAATYSTNGINKWAFGGHTTGVLTQAGSLAMTVDGVLYHVLTSA